ncbi:MAG: FtsH protease activity modulator HflK [Alphaproteobacteria bacterium]
MPWTTRGGGGQGPWGRGPSGPQPPDFEDLLRTGQDRFKKMFPSGIRGGKGFWLVLAAVAAIWLASGVFRVLPNEQGVVLRFGEYVRSELPGLHYHLPWPIESAVTPRVTFVHRTEIGYRAADRFARTATARQVPEEALMLTGDSNIVDINFTVFWVIKDAANFLFKIRDPEGTVKSAAESAMREIIGQTPIVLALAEGRRQIEDDTKDLLQRILDDYESGVEVTQLQLQKVDPPGPVIDAFNDVRRAEADQQRLRNQAEAYRNDIIPRARGDAERILQDAEGYKQEVVARSTGDAKRFLAVYNEYKNAKEVTTRRIYLETMEEVLRNVNKIIIDSGAQGGTGVVPYLPLPEIQKRRTGGRTGGAGGKESP